MLSYPHRPSRSQTRLMPKPRSPSRPAETPPSPPLPRRTAMRRATAERKLRILERLTAGVSVPHIASVENLTIRRVRQIIAEMLASREVDPPAGFVQLQIARLSDAMRIAHTMMMEGDLQALDRVIKLTAELDRYHGFGRAEIAPPPAPPARIAAPAARAAARQAGGRGRGSRSGNSPPCNPLISLKTRQESGSRSSRSPSPQPSPRERGEGAVRTSLRPAPRGEGGRQCRPDEGPHGRLLKLGSPPRPSPTHPATRGEGRRASGARARGAAPSLKGSPGWGPKARRH